MNIDLLIMYTVVAFFYITSPGPAIFLAISNGMTGNMKIVLTSSFANSLGLLMLSVLSILGLGALLMTSSTLFFSVKLVGASYLIYLGIKQFKAGKTAQLSDLNNNDDNGKGLIIYFRESFLLASTNPKPILFFTALFPQFIDVSKQILPQFCIMTSIFMVISFTSLVTYGYISKSASKLVSSQVFHTWFHRIAGGLFIAMGIKLFQLKRMQS